MKRITALLLFVVMLLSLCACGDNDKISPAAQNVNSMIENIGYVSLDKADAIAAAEEAYNALTDAEKAEVEKYGQLVAARQTLEQRKAETELDTISTTYAGVWVQLDLKDVFNYTKFDKLTSELYINTGDKKEVQENTDEYKREHLYSHYYLIDDDDGIEKISPYYVLTLDDNRVVSSPVFTLEEDGKAKNEDFTLDEWEYKDGRIILSGNTMNKAIYDVVTIAGLPVLYYKDEEALLLKKTDVETFLSAVFVKVELDSGNATDYFQVLSQRLDTLGDTGAVDWSTDAYIIDSVVYDQGLIFFASADLSVGITSGYGDVTVNTKIPYGAELQSPPDWCEFGAVTGTIWFIKSDYAQVKFIKGEKRLDTYRRSISFFDGLFTWKDSESSYYGLLPTDDLLF